MLFISLMLNSILIIIVLLTSLPVGYLLAYLTKEELVQYRKYFIALVAVSLIIALILAFISIKNNGAIILTLIYIAVVSLISLLLSYKKRFVR